MREQLLTVTVDWADHEEWCPSMYKVVYCFVCKAKGKIEDNMPTPYGTISTSEGPVNPKEPAVEEKEDEQLSDGQE